LEESKKVKRTREVNPKPLPVVEKDVPPSLPARPMPKIPLKYTFQEATRDTSKSIDTEFMSALQSVDHSDAPNPPIRPSFDRPQTAFKIVLQPQTKTIHDKRWSMPTPLERIEQSDIVDQKPPTPIEKDSFLIRKIQSKTDVIDLSKDPALLSSLQTESRNTEKTIPMNQSDTIRDVTCSTLPIKPGNTINKFWKELYLGQQPDQSQSQLPTFSNTQVSRYGVEEPITVSETQNSLFELPKLDLSLNVPMFEAVTPNSLGKNQNDTLQSNFIANTQTVTRKKIKEEKKNHLISDGVTTLASTLDTPRVSQLQFDMPTTSVIPDQKSFLVTPIALFEDSFSTNSTPTQSFQTAPLNDDHANVSVRSVHGPRPLPAETDHSLSRSMASIQSLSMGRNVNSSTANRDVKKLVGPRPVPTETEESINQTMNQSVGMSMNASMNRSVVGPRPMPKNTFEIMNQSVAQSQSMAANFDDSLISLDHSFDVSMIHGGSMNGDTKGPREEPSGWDVELSFNLGEHRTSTTNKKFKEIFSKLSRK
jgi:hypothetical protein